MLEETFSAVRLSLEEKKSKGIFVVVGLVSFAFLYYFLVAKVADNDISNSVMMSGPGFVTFSVTSGLIASALTGILAAMIVFKFRRYSKIEGRGVVGFVGSGLAAFGTGCPTCGAFLFGLIGAPLALMYFPFRGLELQVAGIGVLLLSIYFTGKSINYSCKIGRARNN